jgi:hypothetical protein
VMGGDGFSEGEVTKYRASAVLQCEGVFALKP